MNKTAHPTPELVIAQALSPKGELVAWLAKQAATTLLRVSVELEVQSSVSPGRRGASELTVSRSKATIVR